ncbi:MAG TPA: AI-2E family transporter [Candidatus Limnocylindrales bacterium]|nr:AI-2E family transporter [Candidatus Limnocylindrales bacterium]
MTTTVRRIQAPTPRVALVLGAAIVLGILLYMARHALTPFIVGALLIYLLDPAVGWLSRQRIAGRRLPRGLAVLIVYVVVVVGFIYGLQLLLGPLVSQLVDYVRDLPALLASVRETLDGLSRTYQSMDLPDEVRSFIDKALAGAGEGSSGVDFSALLPIARTIAGTAAGLFGFLIIPIWAFYILKDRVGLTQRFSQSLPPTWRDETWAILTIVERVFGRWIRGQIILGLIVGAATFAGLLVLGWFVDPRFIQFAVFLAVIAGLLELLPIIGPIISMIPTLLVALTTRDPATAVIGVLILYIAVQQLENAVLVPKIQGDAVELHPSLVIFVLIVGGSIAGLLGAILAIPITAAARDVYRYLFRRLSDDEVPDPPATEDAEIDLLLAEAAAEETAADVAAEDEADADDADEPHSAKPGVPESPTP